MIKKMLKNVDPFKPTFFALEAQEHFIEMNMALKK